MENDINNLDLKLLLDLVPFNMYIKDTHGRLIYCNQNQIFSYGKETLADVIGKIDSDLCKNYEDAKNFRENDMEVMISEKAKIFEERFLIQNTHKFMLSYKTPIKENNITIGVFGISIDVSQMKYQTSKLEHEKYLIQNTLENIIARMPGHVYWLDTNNVYLGCNEAQAKDAGLDSPKDIIGKTNYDLPWKEQANVLNAINNMVMKTKIEHIAEEESLLADGSKNIYHSIKAPLFDENNDVSGVLGISFDITDKKKLENELKSKNTELERVLAKYKNFVLNQEHDIRTPVSSVAGLAGILLDRLKDPEDIKIAQLLLQSAEAQKAYQNTMIDSLYLFQRETERYSRRFDLRKKLGQVENIFLCAFHEKQLNFSLKYDETIPKKLIGDWFRLQQILVCLLSNATKFTEANGRIELRCQGISKTDQEVVVMIEIEDSGIGIEENKLETIFEPFVRLTLSNLGKYEGRGLGLTFVKKMVEELCGEIDITSVVGKGTVVQLLLPYRVSLSDKSPSLSNRLDS